VTAIGLLWGLECIGTSRYRPAQGFDFVESVATFLATIAATLSRQRNHGGKAFEPVVGVRWFHP
jgi:hypothetical protein